MMPARRQEDRMRLLPMPAALLALAGCASLPGIYELPPPPAAASAAPSAEAPAVARIGAPAPDIAFTAVDGQRHLLSEYKGKFLALVFFAHW
jgi:hypothetical protein